ncbi:uncharacterized protein LOC116853560 [Odontomachus brunneus]|uniref:uncharacterized protein LOC116853560 n=1 Tax=Odontomachus brunneus TaxID=486640 RepID=UPI0013F28FB0|nr:uncharacterized protein LOC116853560 [Odontomachus brunneus]
MSLIKIRAGEVMCGSACHYQCKVRLHQRASTRCPQHWIVLTMEMTGFTSCQHNRRPGYESREESLSEGQVSSRRVTAEICPQQAEDFSQQQHYDHLTPVPHRCLTVTQQQRSPN